MGKTTTDVVDLERRLIAAKGDPRQHAQVRQEIREAGLPQLADELDRIAARDQGMSWSRPA